MTAKPVTARAAGPALPMEVETAAGPAGAGPTGAPKKAAMARAAGAKGATPGATRSGARLGKSVDKALGKTKPPATGAASKPGGAVGSQRTATSGYSSAATQATGEWAFLSDKNLPIEEKLFRYMMLLQKKADTELQQFMEATGPDAKAGSSTAKKSGTSFFDVAKAIVPALGLAESLIGEAGLKKLAGQVAGPALAAAAAAVGMPALAPLALQLGGSLAQMAFQEVGTRSASSSSTTAPTANEYSKMSDQQKALWLQHLMEKQKAMFSAISNSLRTMHDTQMAAIHNIR